MKFVQLFFVAIALLLTHIFIAWMPHNSGWHVLFNGKNLDGWDTYIAPPINSDGKLLSSVPVGLNHDPQQVFSVVPMDGEKVIRISGQQWGAVITQKEYSNFHLQLKFKWGHLLWGQKRGKKMDSGILYFSVGENGADAGAWMRSQEFQVEQGNCGDYWGVAGAAESIPVTKMNDSVYVYNPKGQILTFSANSKNGRHCVKRSDAENKTGEWNTLDLYCHGDTSVHVVNGKVMMVLYHSAQNNNGQMLPLTKGKIQIQSEGAEIYYKDIWIKSIASLPERLLQ
ncbi:MAG: DUF1080 domain-containing protein [Sphingobacteriales bacterium]|uniref:3-keto-disaccharide hydrolase n=1 Tax=Hydrotalea flava TaxID=714549 RepID=UPI00082FED04|nr:DUF1080 domain-containing protein [Hydrotalea flava]RTL47637.1 MAG: DUF1080 domain-containing protein [Sphingobacteriales bacterium]